MQASRSDYSNGFILFSHVHPGFSRKPYQTNWKLHIIRYINCFQAQALLGEYNAAIQSGERSLSCLKTYFSDAPECESLIREVQSSLSSWRIASIEASRQERVVVRQAVLRRYRDVGVWVRKSFSNYMTTQGTSFTFYYYLVCNWRDTATILVCYECFVNSRCLTRSSTAYINRQLFPPTSHVQQNGVESWF